MATLHCGWMLLVLLGALMFGGGAAQAAGQVIGTVQSLRGSATVRVPETSTPTPLAANAELRQGEIVRTGPDSRMKLALRDGSTLALGADTELELDSLALTPGSVSLFVQLSGFVRAVIAPLRPGTQFLLSTPSMVAAVRGTEWIQHYEAGKTEIVVTKGRVQASSPTGKAEERVTLAPGEGVAFNAPAIGTRAVGSKEATHTPVVRWDRNKVDLFEAATRIP